MTEFWSQSDIKLVRAHLMFCLILSPKCRSRTTFFVCPLTVPVHQHVSYGENILFKSSHFKTKGFMFSRWFHLSLYNCCEDFSDCFSSSKSQFWVNHKAKPGMFGISGLQVFMYPKKWLPWKSVNHRQCYRLVSTFLSPL